MLKKLSLLIFFTMILSFNLNAKPTNIAMPQRRVHTRLFTHTVRYIEKEITKIITCDFSSLIKFEDWIKKHKKDHLLKVILAHYSELDFSLDYEIINKKFKNEKEFLLAVYSRSYLSQNFDDEKIPENSLFKKWLPEIKCPNVDFNLFKSSEKYSLQGCQDLSIEERLDENKSVVGFVITWKSSETGKNMLYVL